MLGVLKQKYMKLPLWLWLGGAALAAGGLLAVALNQPQYASWRYGACKVFLEHELRFPETIHVLVGGEQILNNRQSKAVVGFSSINAFGSQQVKVFECYFDTDANGAPTLSKLMLDSKPYPADKVAQYGAMLGVILTQELDTALPENLPRDLEDFRQ